MQAHFTKEGLMRMNGRSLKIKPLSKRLSVVLGLATLTYTGSASLSAEIAPDAWQIRGAEDANFGQIRSEYRHQPDIWDDIGRNPYSRVRKISIFSLYGDPKNHLGQMVGVIGYLSRTKGCESNALLYFYPTLESYELGHTREALKIELNPHFKGIEKFESGKRIEAIGNFKTNEQGKFEQSFGSLNDASIRIVTPKNR